MTAYSPGLIHREAPDVYLLQDGVDAVECMCMRFANNRACRTVGELSE